MKYQRKSKMLDEHRWTLTKLKRQIMRPLSVCCLLSAFAVTSPSVGHPPADRSIDKQGLVQYEAMFAEQEEVGKSVAIQGTAKTKGGAVLVELVPSQSELAVLGVGDGHRSVTIGGTRVRDDGGYTVRLDLEADMFDQDRNLFLFHLDEGGRVIDAGATSLRFVNGAQNVDGWKRRELARVGVVNFNESTPMDKTAVEQIADDKPGLVEYHPADCHWYTVETDIMTPTTVAVAGTNTQHAKVTTTFARDTSSELGVGVKVGGDPWSASGSWKVENKSGFTKVWPASNSYGTYSFRMEVEYHRQRYECFSGVTERLVPAGYTTGNFAPVKWSTTAYPTYCTAQSAGTLTIDSSRATTWNNGVKLSWAKLGAVDVSSQSGYTDKTKIEFEFTSNDKQLCGRYDYPAGGNPGYLMADFTDR